MIELEPPIPRLILEINVSELLPVVVAHDKAGGLLFDRPRRREAAREGMDLREGSTYRKQPGKR
jgi:hypothetical protein